MDDKTVDAVKIGAAYVRVSTDDQLEYSPDSQIKAVRDYAKREGYIIPDEYVFQDDGISGKSAQKRPAFRLMIATAKQEPAPFSAIFVWKYSRFARNQEEAIMYKNLLRKKGIDVKSISEPSSDSPFASLIERIIEWMDEYYLINLAEEVRRGMTEKVNRGEACGKPPYGYDVVDNILVPNKDAEVVRYIFGRYADGVGIRAITGELIARGIKTRNNADPYLRWVRYILMNPAYIGKLRWNAGGSKKYDRVNVCSEKTDIVDGRHDAIIDMETWNAVQKKIVGKDLDKYRRSNSSDYMLRGMMRCSDCGATLVRINRPGGSYFQCNRYTSGSCQKSHYISTHIANESVLNALEKCLENETFSIAPAKGNRASVKTDWNALLLDEGKKLDRAKNAYLDGTFSLDDYKKIKSAVEKTIQKIKDGMALDEEQNPQTEPINYKERTVKVLDVLKSPEVPEIEKNRALRSIVDRIVFDRENNSFDIYFLP